MQQDKQASLISQPCPEWEQWLTLFAAGEEEEIEPGKRGEVAAHLSECAQCSNSLQREQELLSVLTAHRDEPDAALLASCRASLEDALDREEEGSWLWRTLSSILPANWLSPRPAFSAAVLIMIGFAVGILGPRMFRQPAQPPATETASSNSDPAAPATGANTDSKTGNTMDPVSSAIGSLDLHSADLAGLNILPSDGGEMPQVQFQLKAQQPVTIQGNVDNENVESVLLYILRNGDRFCPDVRLNAVDLLRARASDPNVRSALCHAVRSDSNAAVRLKAIEALNNSAQPNQDIVRQTLLNALVEDDNPGVRVEAINALRDMAAKGEVSGDDETVSILRDRMEKDPNNYIRLQSAATISDLGPRAKF